MKPLVTAMGHRRNRLSRRIGIQLIWLTIVAASATVIGPATTFAAAGDWAQFRESQTHQAHNTNETVLSDITVPSLGLAWTGATGGAVNSSPTVANGVVYVGSADGKLYAFAVGCGNGGGACTPLWSSAAIGALDSSPAVAGGVVYIGSADGKLYAFAVGCASGGGTCSPVWSSATLGAIHSSPSVDAGVIYVGSNDGKLYAFAAGCATGGATCSPVWSGATGAAIASSPAVASGVVYVGSDDHKLYAFAVGCASGGLSCTPLWTALTGGAVHASPSVLTGVVYVGSLDGNLYAFDAAGVTGCSGGLCTPIWMATTGGPIYSSPSVGDGRVWTGSDDGKVYAFRVNCNTGGGLCTPQWTGDVGHAIRSSSASAHDVLYFGASDGKLYAFDADCGTGGAVCTPAWSHTIGTDVQSSPAVSDGVVYAGSSDHRLYAFHLRVDHLVLSPATTSINAGIYQAYMAEAFNAASVDLGDVTSLTTFTISTGICTANSCGAIVGGDFTVTATYAGATGTAALHVTLVGSTYVPIKPVRLLDTRAGNGLSGKLHANTPATFQIAGRAGSGIPASASAVTGNVTVVNETNSWAVYLGPSPIAAPSTSTINFSAGQITGNGLTVALSASGTLSATYISTAGNTTDLVFDVTGFFIPDASGATYHAISPSRLLDTRSGNGLAAKLKANTPATFTVAGRAGSGIPANAVAVTGNVTVVNASNSWAVYLGPDPVAAPTTSTINFSAAEVKGNSLTVALGTGGNLSATYISTAGNTTDLVFDVTGYYTADVSGAKYVPISPARLLDTRFGNGLSAKLSANTPATFVVGGRGLIPANASAVTGNVTVVNETNSWAVFLGPVPTASPGTSTINFNKGDVKGNGLTVALGTGGTLSATYISTSGNTTDLVLDVTGYFLM